MNKKIFNFTLKYEIILYAENFLKISSIYFIFYISNLFYFLFHNNL